MKTECLQCQTRQRDRERYRDRESDRERKRERDSERSREKDTGGVDGEKLTECE